MLLCCLFFFFNDTATTEIYTLSLHDALPILLARIRALLRRAGPQTGRRALTFADLTLDPATREVRRGRERIDLRPTEFALLEALMADPGRVMTRSVLYETDRKS